MLNFNLKTIDDTKKLAQKLAHALCSIYNNDVALPINAIFLHGELGSGKTSFTRELVHGLPNGQEAEVSSPSFTLCNSYATRPEVLHVDLYRCEQSIPQELWDALDIPDNLIIVEWAEFLPNDALPQNFLDIYFKICEQSRAVLITAHGLEAENFLQNLPVLQNC